jgi:threonyl-tRNA synthetase
LSSDIKITLPGSTVKTAEKGLTASFIIEKFGLDPDKKTIAAVVNGNPVDLYTPVTGDAEFKIITFESREGRDIFWHSTSHLMAQAVKRLFPKAKCAIGPSIDNGFYYDFDVDPISADDLVRIENEMKKIVAENLPIRREELSHGDAVRLFRDLGEDYKVEMIEDLGAAMVSIYRQGEFVDLCRGPHLESTSLIRAFKLTTVAGAYWRGDESKKMLQRIYGTSYPDKKSLDDYLSLLEEAKKRDHRKLGRDLDLYSVHEDAGGGLIYWHPYGGRIRTLLEDWWRKEHYANGYEILYTPHIGRANLWETSGHLGFYKENMYSPMEIDKNDYYIKPMNCPFHIKIYQTSLHSYRDLPLRWAELGTVYRYEKSGVLHGLLRVRGFTQDDAHIFCTPEQMVDEILEVLRFSMRIWKTLGFSDIKAYIATKPEGSVGDEERWEQAQKSLMKAVESEKLSFEMDPGGGAFYGPKIDLKVRDAIGREWQMTTIQFDFNLPDRFEMYYIGEDGQKHRPYMIHRALLGSIERFFGILIEHYAGKFPLWLAPVQAMLINVSGDEADHVKSVRKNLNGRGIRAEMDLRDESMGYKVRDAISRKVPYICVFGKKEIEQGVVSVRKHGENKSTLMKLDDLAQIIDEEVRNYR